MNRPDLYVKKRLKIYLWLTVAVLFSSVVFAGASLLLELLERSSSQVYYFSATELIIAAAVVIVLLVISYIIGKKRYEKIFAKLLGDAYLQVKETSEKLSAAQLYNSAWFISAGSEHKKKKKHQDDLEMAVIRRGGHVDSWGHVEPEEALDAEEEMIYRCSKTETEYEAARIISIYVPKIIEKLVYSQDYIDDLSKKDKKKFKTLCDKYCISINR